MTNDDKLIATASSWCASHGVLMGARDPSTRQRLGEYVYEPAPFSLFPTDFSKSAFAKAYSLAKPFSNVVHNASSDFNWLEKAIEGAAAGDADFTGKLLLLAKQVVERGRSQNVVLGILRSDYMLHGKSLPEAIPLQVELNTIASSFGCLSSKVTKMHQQLYPTNLPDNGAADGIAKGIALALDEYNRQFPDSKAAVVVMVVQPGESNSCDQRDLEFLLLSAFNKRLIRKSLLELATETELMDNKELWLRNEQVMAGVVYYRAGYTPDDYPTKAEWEGRSMVEHSAAIKCPDIFYHLFGAKKIQQAIASPGVLRQFCRSDEEDALLRSCFAGLYALGEGDDSDVVRKAIAHPHDYVLKPQREGGGNNLYDDDLVEALQTMSYSQRGAYILMQKIVPPSAPGTLVRAGKVAYDGDCVCELGVFGVSLREYGGDRVILDDVVGHILRAKNLKTDEGGVAAGYAFLSSPKLV